MAIIDLERLIVRQTYFVPFSISITKTRILQELNRPYPQIIELTAWRMAEIGSHVEYFYSYRYSATEDYLIKKGTLLKPEKNEIREFLREYDSKFPESGFEEVKSRRVSLPDMLHVTFKATEGGCQCKVECLPVLYRRLSQHISEELPDDFHIQDTFLTCKRFVETLFEGGLSATIISEEKKEPSKPTAQLLVNDQTSRQIIGKIGEMLGQATGEVLLCGWIGTLLLPKLKEINQKGVNIRMITHKDTELKGKPGHRDVQTAFRELISMIGKDNISIRPECHCRVVVVDNKALIGSMDLNAISLTGSHRELAIYTEDPEIVRNLRKYFNGIFSPLSKEKAK